MFKRTSSFTVAGGGVHGKAVGIAPNTMTEVGHITEVYHLFTEMFLPPGETITGINNGMVISGNNSGYLKETYNAIGADGKETSTGKNITPGVCKDYSKNGTPKEL